MGLVRLVFQTRKPVAAAQNPAINQKIFFMALTPPRVAICGSPVDLGGVLGLDARRASGVI
jgi:hypothetical protein